MPPTLTELPRASATPSPAEVETAIQAAKRKPTGAAGGGAIGGTIRPVYGERRPMMYQLLETEMRRVSNLNSQALVWFSAGGFCLATSINIVISSLFAADPLTDIAKIALRYGCFTAFVLSAIFYLAGWWAVRTRESDIKRIKDETRSV